MHVHVRELLARAAYNGITRKQIAEKAGIAQTTFTKWKSNTPRLDTLAKANKALDELVELKGDL